VSDTILIAISVTEFICRYRLCRPERGPRHCLTYLITHTHTRARARTHTHTHTHRASQPPRLIPLNTCLWFREQRLCTWRKAFIGTAYWRCSILLCYQPTLCMWRRIGEMLSLGGGSNWVAGAHCSQRTALCSSDERVVDMYCVTHPESEQPVTANCSVPGNFCWRRSSAFSDSERVHVSLFLSLTLIEFPWAHT
jgi:hypothetical protein